MYDFREYLQKQLDNISINSYVVSNERNINTNFKKIEVIVSQLSATITDSEASDIPYEITIVTSDIEKVMNDFTTIAKVCSGVSYTEVGENGVNVITTCEEAFFVKN